MSFRIIIYFCISLITAILGKEARIVGGIDADIREFPYLVSLRKIRHNDHFCGGTIVTEWHILTAGHCFVNEDHDLDRFRAYTGTSNSSDTSAPAYRLAYVDIHPKYFAQVTETMSHHNDIAIITVRSRIIFNSFTNKAVLPTSESRPGQSGFLAGWGYTKYPGVTPQQLQKARMTILDHSRCQERVEFVIHPEQLCAFQRSGVGSCVGDSGGPLIVRGVVVGISSFNLPCAKGVPDIYTDVYNYIDFILPLIKM